MADYSEEWETYRKLRNIALAVFRRNTSAVGLGLFLVFLVRGHDYVFVPPFLAWIFTALYSGALVRGWPTMREALRLQVVVLKYGIIGEVLCTPQPEQVCE
jgi:hypothetical protein